MSFKTISKKMGLIYVLIFIIALTLGLKLFLPSFFEIFDLLFHTLVKRLGILTIYTYRVQKMEATFSHNLLKLEFSNRHMFTTLESAHSRSGKKKHLFGVANFTRVYFIICCFLWLLPMDTKIFQQVKKVYFTIICTYRVPKWKKFFGAANFNRV